MFFNLHCKIHMFIQVKQIKNIYITSLCKLLWNKIINDSVILTVYVYNYFRKKLQYLFYSMEQNLNIWGNSNFKTSAHIIWSLLFMTNIAFENEKKRWKLEN